MSKAHSYCVVMIFDRRA